MGRSCLFRAVIFALFWLSASAMAAPVLDQHQDAADTFSASFWAPLVWAQTFTAGQSGVLDHLEIGLDGTAPATVEITNVVVGQPGTTLLGSVSMPSGFVSGWNSIDFVSQGISLSNGTMYAIVLVNTQPSTVDTINAKWDPASYAAGQMLYNWQNTGWQSDFPEHGQGDMQFRTYVEVSSPVPAPGALLLASLGATTIGWLRKRHSL